MSYHCNLVSYSIDPKIIHCSATYWRIAVPRLLFLILHGIVFSVFLANCYHVVILLPSVMFCSLTLFFSVSILQFALSRE